ncbi:MAG: hypothetical protein O2894_13660 [Planctomycetota bacterium]|nr:hypothetical protein [Planctomycetota bacterium]
MIDRKTKALLLAIALGLWANVAAQFARPRELQARQQDVSGIERYVRQIAIGTCTNSKIC